MGDGWLHLRPGWGCRKRLWRISCYLLSVAFGDDEVVMARFWGHVELESRIEWSNQAVCNLLSCETPMTCSSYISRRAEFFPMWTEIESLWWVADGFWSLHFGQVDGVGNVLGEFRVVISLGSFWWRSNSYASFLSSIELFQKLSEEASGGVGTVTCSLIFCIERDWFLFDGLLLLLCIEARVKV